jgi:hypothetical protein
VFATGQGEFVRLAAVFILAAALPMTATASTITVTITGSTGEIEIGEGPVFGHSSYQHVPPGLPFALTYTFDEEKGKQTTAEAAGELITQSQIEGSDVSSPGVNAVLRIGSSMWEFGASTRSQVTLKTAADSKSEEFAYATRSGANRVSCKIMPSKGGYWPRNGDWRASFISTSIDGSTASFSADNDRVSAKGKLVPSTILVAGVDLDGQWLRSTTADASGERKWELAHASPAGGYIVEQVSRIILGKNPNGSAITPSSVKYWQAWQVPAGAKAPGNTVDDFPSPGPAGSTGEDNVTAVARFYEGLVLPSGFAEGNSPYAHGRLSATSDPNLSTVSATLPVATNASLHF